MNGVNKVILLGNLGADGELRVTPSGQAILKLRLATTESYLDKNNQRQERTSWHSVSVWGKRGEALSKILNKGTTVYVEGRLQTSTYEKNGEKRYSVDVVATDVVLCGGRRNNESSQEDSGQERRAYGGGTKSQGHVAKEKTSAQPGGSASDDGDYGSGFGGGDDSDIPF